MTGLRNPDARRALRSIVQAIVALAITALLFWLAWMLRDDVASLRLIAQGALIIVGLGTLLYGAENVTRAVKLSAGVIKAEIGGET